MHSPLTYALQVSWIVIFLFAFFFKLRCFWLTRLLGKEYQVNVKKNALGSSLSIKELMKLHEQITPKEIKYLLARLIDSKIWLYTLLVAAIIIFVAANFF